MTDFGTIMAAASMAGVPVELSRNIKLKDIKLPDPDIEFNNSFGNESGVINSLRIIPNINYDEKDIYMLFNFEINVKRRELDIYLFTNKSEDVDKYPFNLHMEISSKGKITLNIDSNFSERISDNISFNNMMNIWSNRGLRRLRIHGLMTSNVVTIVPDRINFEHIKYEENFKDILNTALVGTDEIPCLISKDMQDKIKKIGRDINDKDICEGFLKKFRESTPKEQTKLTLLLKDEEENILLSTCLGVFPYFINLDFIKIRPNNKESKDIIKNVYEREHGIYIQKFLFNDKMYDYCDKIINIFRNEEHPIDKALNEILNCTGSYPTGKFEIEINKKKNGFWYEKQDITFTFKIVDNEIEDRIALKKLLTEEKFIESIPLMELREDENLESLAFAYYIKGDYKKALEMCEESINVKYDSVAHFTMGLVYLIEGNYDKAFESYMIGIYLVKPDIWYPGIKENIKIAISEGKINENEHVKNILGKIELYKLRRKSNKRLNTCFCGSKKNFYDCHGKKYKL